jgi:hypothetical protein
MIHPQYAPAVKATAMPDRRAAYSSGSWSLGHSEDAGVAIRRLAVKREI